MIDVACAVIMNETGAVLLAQRGVDMDLSGKWEFPGGKIEPGETAITCIVREIWEELGVEVKTLSALKPVVHCYPEKQVRLYPVRCTIMSGQPQCREHQQIGWFSMTEMRKMDIADADVKVYELLI